MESHPEENDNGKDEAEAYDALLRLGGRKLGLCGRGILRLFGLLFFLRDDMLIGAAEGIVDGDGDNQAQAGYDEGKMVRVCLAHAKLRLSITHHLDGGGGGKHGTDVDGHIEEREATVALVGIFRVVIQTSDHHLEVALEESCAETDENKGETHGRSSNEIAAEGHGKDEITDEHDENSRRHHATEAETVSGNTSDDGEEIDHHEECGIHTTGETRLPAEVGLQEEEEDGQHGVVAETLARIGQRESP